LAENQPIGEGWHLDKRVPISLIAMLLAQIMAFAWWGSNLDARVASLEAAAPKTFELSERMARIEEQTKSAGKTLERIESKLDQKADK